MGVYLYDWEVFSLGSDEPLDAQIAKWSAMDDQARVINVSSTLNISDLYNH
jgi:hypothetical protein